LASLSHDLRGTAMSGTLANAIGAALRGARKARGLTLRDTAGLSSGRFKSSSLASYERGERAISVERFLDLTALYRIAPARVIADISRRVEGKPATLIDLRRLKLLGGTEAATLEGFIRNVFLLRGEPVADTISLRDGDLDVLATASGRRVNEFRDALGSAFGGAPG
jgi:transcriptional regulator with XRE-family HTH domain